MPLSILLPESNDTIEILNMSWNHIRSSGSVALANGLKVCEKFIPLMNSEW